MSRPPNKAMEAVKRYCEKKKRAMVVHYMLLMNLDIVYAPVCPKDGK